MVNKIPIRSSLKFLDMICLAINYHCEKSHIFYSFEILLHVFCLNLNTESSLYPKEIKLVLVLDQLNDNPSSLRNRKDKNLGI